MDSAHSPSPDVLLRNVPDLTSTTERVDNQAFAHGGYADIWRGVERSGGTERDIVIKMIRVSPRDEVNIDRIKKGISREVIAWRSLNHKNILPFYGLCWPFGYGQHCLPSLVFPYCEAGTCIDYLKRHSNADRTSIIQQIAGALDYLHALDPPVIHGDIKACNILMRNDGMPMLADFGLSRVMMEGPTGLTTSSIRGSCRWMAPELFGDSETDASAPVSEESDVWAFGCLCLEVLWDTLPWASIKTDPRVILAVTSKRQPTLPKGVESTALGRIVQRCWAYKAEDRPSMAQLLFALLFGTLESTPNQLFSNPDPIAPFFRSVQGRNQLPANKRQREDKVPPVAEPGIPATGPSSPKRMKTEHELAAPTDDPIESMEEALAAWLNVAPGPGGDGFDPGILKILGGAEDAADASGLARPPSLDQPPDAPRPTAEDLFDISYFFNTPEDGDPSAFMH